MSSSYNPKSSVIRKIPPFDKQNFVAWKSKAMDILEIMDYDMLDVNNKGPIVSMHRSSTDNASFSGLKQKFVFEFNKEEK